MKIQAIKNELNIILEEDATLDVEYVDGMYLSSIIDNSIDDPDWDDVGQAYCRRLTIDAAGCRFSIDLTTRDAKALELQLAEPPKRRKRRESPPDWLTPKKPTRG